VCGGGLVREASVGGRVCREGTCSTSCVWESYCFIFLFVYNWRRTYSFLLTTDCYVDTFVLSGVTMFTIRMSRSISLSCFFSAVVSSLLITTTLTGKFRS